MVFVLSGPPQRNRRPRAHRACVPFGMVGQRRDAQKPRSCLRAHDDGGQMALPPTLKANQVTCMVQQNLLWRTATPNASRRSLSPAPRRLVRLGPELPAARAIERRFGADNVEKSMRQQLTRFGLAAGLLAGTTCVALAQGSSSPSAASGSSTRDCTDQSSNTTGSLGGGSSTSGTSGTSAGLGTSGSSSLTGGSGACGTSGSSADLSGSGSGSSISGSGTSGTSGTSAGVGTSGSTLSGSGPSAMGSRSPC